MRKLILSMMVSLDGMIARPDGDLGWFLSDGEFESEMLDLLRNVDSILLGRVSYQLLADYWPSAGTPAASEAPGGFTSRNREIAFARLMNSIPKVVYSRTLTRGRAPRQALFLLRAGAGGVGPSGPSKRDRHCATSHLVTNLFPPPPSVLMGEGFALGPALPAEPSERSPAIGDFSWRDPAQRSWPLASSPCSGRLRWTRT
jgi:RibD C-terminal domain